MEEFRTNLILQLVGLFISGILIQAIFNFIIHQVKLNYDVIMIVKNTSVFTAKCENNVCILPFVIILVCVYLCCNNILKI